MKKTDVNQRLWTPLIGPGVAMETTVYMVLVLRQSSAQPGPDQTDRTDRTQRVQTTTPHKQQHVNKHPNTNDDVISPEDVITPVTLIHWIYYHLSDFNVVSFFMNRSDHL